ncbi:MAG: family 43 glycosylhydrolase [Candidatus Krumholzibacteriota bacterium]|nr:family 43 glycosylhydrolase [Candidatus Krumholzibacteriota bacterium]
MRRDTIILAAGLCLAASAAGAGICLDFEQPLWVEPLPAICKDHTLVRHEDLYHIFYIQSFPPPGGQGLRWDKWLGHLTSPDLRHWTRQDSILPVAEVPDTWEDGFIWAPEVLRLPWEDAWYLFYTGVDIPTVSQQTGAAYSDDLFHWTRLHDNPLYHPTWWSNWSDTTWANCRDPDLFQEDASAWYLLNTAMTSDIRGAISLAISGNLVDWIDLAPLFVNDSWHVLESPQLLKRDGWYHLFFTEEDVGLTAHMASAHLWYGWDKDTAVLIDGGRAAEISVFDDETIFSRHRAAWSAGGSFYFYQFDDIAFETPGAPPVITSRLGLQDHWHVLFGDAFDRQPTFGDNPTERGDESSGMEGNSYLATYEDHPSPVQGLPGSAQGEAPVGLLRSDVFTVTEERVRLLVGGGDDPDRCFAALVSDATGRLLFHEAGTGGHAMSPRLWDTSSLLGEAVFVAVADLSAEAGGFISVDGIIERAAAAEDTLPPAAPLAAGPRLADLIAAAGFPPVAAPPVPAPAAGRLLAPHPNPFNPHCRLRYEIAAPGRVELLVAAAAGRRVRLLAVGRREPGPGYFVWDGQDDAGRRCVSGAYVATLLLEGRPLDSRRLVLLR